MKKYLKPAFINTLPVMAGYIVLGIGFGIVALKSGLALLHVALMSILIYAGSMQFVAVSLISSGASLITAVVTTLMVNARHIFYGISMVEKFKGAGKKKPYMIFALTDETYSLVCDGKCDENLNFHTYSLFVSIFNHIYWVLGSVIGAILGSAITFNTSGIDFAMTALFITVFVEQWKSTKKHLPALIGLISSIICLVIFGKDNFLIPSMILISLALSLGKKKIEKEAE